jgi:homoserine O-acetyltransferase
MEITLSQPETKQLDLPGHFELEGGESLPSLSIRYTTWGELNPDKSNVVWIFHALIGNYNPLEWWGGLFGQENTIDPEKHYIVCANVLGSCYGTTGPDDFNFPFITIRDQVHAHQKLAEHLGIEDISIGIGGSLGGQQLLEWAVMEPDRFKRIIPICTNAIHSPWGIAFNEAQRMALGSLDLEKGLEAARAIAMLSYRNYQTYDNSQKDLDQRWDDFSASSYQRHQGEKLRKRFTPFAYYTLSKAMDSHNVGRHYLSIEHALKRITADCLVIGITSDLLFPVNEQRFIAEHIKNASLKVIESNYGHDGFLLEYEQLNLFIREFIR